MTSRYLIIGTMLRIDLLHLYSPSEGLRQLYLLCGILLHFAPLPLLSFFPFPEPSFHSVVRFSQEYFLINHFQDLLLETLIQETRKASTSLSLFINNSAWDRKSTSRKMDRISVSQHSSLSNRWTDKFPGLLKLGWFWFLSLTTKRNNSSGWDRLTSFLAPFNNGSSEGCPWGE